MAKGEDRTESLHVRIPSGAVKNTGTLVATVVLALGGTAGYNGMYGGTNGVARAQDALEVRVSEIEHEQARNETRIEKIDAIDKEVTTIAAKLENLDGRMENLDKRVERNHDAVMTELRRQR